MEVKDGLWKDWFPQTGAVGLSWFILPLGLNSRRRPFSARTAGPPMCSPLGLGRFLGQVRYTRVDLGAVPTIHPT